MLKKIMRRISGGANPDELENCVPEVAKRWREFEPSPEDATQGRYNPHLLSEDDWEAEFRPLLRRALCGYLGRQQAIGLRALIIAASTNRALAEYFLSLRCDDERARLAAKGIEKLEGLDPSQIYDTCSRLWRSSELTLACLRALAGRFFNDASENDYLLLLLRTAKLYYEQTLDLKVAKAKDDIYVLEALVPITEHTFRQVCQSVLAGGNYDSSDLDKKPEDEEEDDKPEVPKVQTISPDQLDQLYDLLTTRVQRLSRGELYRSEGMVPTDIARVIQVDSGLMLIGLSECVTDHRVAEAAVREVLHRWIGSLGLSEDEKADISCGEEIALDMQNEMLTCWVEKREEGSLAGLGLIVAGVLFKLDVDRRLTKDDSLAWARLGAALIDDIWEMYAKTKNLFGYSLGTGLSTSPSERTT